MKSVFYLLAVCAIALCIQSCDDNKSDKLSGVNPEKFTLEEYLGLLGDSEADFMADHPTAIKSGINIKKGDNLGMLCSFDVSGKCEYYPTVFEFVNNSLACIEFNKEFSKADIEFCIANCENICTLSDEDINISVKYGEKGKTSNTTFTSLSEFKKLLSLEKEYILNISDYLLEYTLIGKCKKENNQSDAIPVIIKYAFYSTSENGKRENNSKIEYCIGERIK